MNKRIRKKKCVGEFKELAFQLAAKYNKLTPETADEFVEKLLGKAKELDMICGGSFDLDNFEFYVITGRINTRNEERKQQLVEFVKSLPGMDSVEAGEFVDAWYTPIENDCECECGCEDHDHTHE